VHLASLMHLQLSLKLRSHFDPILNEVSRGHHDTPLAAMRLSLRSDKYSTGNLQAKGAVEYGGEQGRAHKGKRLRQRHSPWPFNYRSEKVCVRPHSNATHSKCILRRRFMRMRIASTYWLALAGGSMMRRR
jgi:hypothetical protein